MAEKVSTMEVRQRIGDILNRVALRHDEFIITRKGKALAALVPIERLEQMRHFAKSHGQGGLKQKKEHRLSNEEAVQLALTLQDATNRPSTKARKKKKKKK